MDVTLQIPYWQDYWQDDLRLVVVLHLHTTPVMLGQMIQM
jgi:hypothetical protein